MALTPLLSFVGRKLAARLTPEKAIDPELTVRPAAGQSHAIVVGYGRVGKVVCELLREHRIPYIVADSDPITVTRDRRDGHDVYFGDATDPQFLEACGLAKAAGVIITIHSARLIDEVVEPMSAPCGLDILIVSRARDADHARHLYALGATDAVPETIEASLQLSEAALVGLGVATGLAIASIHEKRDEIRRTLQDAAREAGLSVSHAVKAKTHKVKDARLTHGRCCKSRVRFDTTSGSRLSELVARGHVFVQIETKNADGRTSPAVTAH